MSIRQTTVRAGNRGSGIKKKVTEGAIERQRERQKNRRKSNPIHKISRGGDDKPKEGESDNESDNES